MYKGTASRKAKQASEVRAKANRVRRRLWKNDIAISNSWSVVNTRAAAWHKEEPKGAWLQLNKRAPCKKDCQPGQGIIATAQEAVITLSRRVDDD
jgi:hypothetical protein